MRLRLSIVILATLSACAPMPERGPLVTPASEEARPLTSLRDVRDGRPSDAIERRLLDAHNAERRVVGVPALTWSDELEVEARDWAGELAATNTFAHDPRPHGHGENLWTGWGGRVWTPEEMIGEWVSEKAQYRPGVFPNVSRTGNWVDVGHYTALVWRGTTHVGCAIVTAGDRQVLACRYAPPGNVDGMRVS